MMITLIRWYLIKKKEIKWKLALYQFIDKQIKEITENPEKLEKKIMSSLADLIQDTKQEE